MFQSATTELMRRPVKASKNPKFLPIWGVVNDNDEGEREIWGVLVAMGDGGGADIGQDSHGLWGILWGHALENGVEITWGD